MPIILVRHGETLLNVARTLQPADTPLSPTGLAQAAAVAQRLAGMAVGGILSSDLPRAQATAEAIAQATGEPVHYTALLHERNFGQWRGRPYDAFDRDPLAMTDAPPGGESLADFHARVARAFDEVVRRQQALSAPLVVVTHGLVIHALLHRHLQVAAPHVVPAKLGNTSVTVCAAAAPHAVSLVDCTVHLPRAVQHKADSLSGG